MIKKEDVLDKLSNVLDPDIKKDLVTLCLRSTLTAFGILLVFWLFGSALLQMMGININSFRIVGGLFLMVIAYQMVFEQRQRRKEETAEAAIDDEELSSLATFPLAIPLMAGPGAITLVMLLSEKSGSSIENQVIGFSPIIIVLAIFGGLIVLSLSLIHI